MNLPPELTPECRFLNGCNQSFQRAFSPESDFANDAFGQYLRANVQASRVLHNLRGQIRSFQKVAPRAIICKCIDGRVHTSVEIGFPPTSVKFLRTEGTIVDLSANNALFWNRLHSVIVDAQRHTADCPALLLAMAHRAELGSGCAAHGGDDEAALAVVQQQAEELRQHFRPEHLYALHGIMNTDDHSVRLFFPDGHELDTAQIIRLLDSDGQPLRQPSDAFLQKFLDQPLDDRQTGQLVGGLTPRALLQGPDALMFHDMQAMIAMEAYLADEVSRLVGNRSRNNVVFDNRLFQTVLAQVDAIAEIPQLMKSPLVYQTIWNIAYALHERLRLDQQLDEHERALMLDHGENMVAYGEGFEIEPRNTLVVVQLGRGRDLDALQVARKVIMKHRNCRRPQEHPPLVHINLEIAGGNDTWHAFNDNVLARLLTLTTNVYRVFEADCRLLTTYSYRHEKRFYPIRLQPDPTLPGNDPRECFPSDVGQNLTEENFCQDSLRLREESYTQSLSSTA